MPFIGQEPITGAFHKLDAITTSSTNTYNLLLNGGAYSPASANHLMVSLNGVIQSPGDSFTVSGSQITFVPSSGTLTSSDSIDFIMAYGDVLNIGTPSDGSVNTNQLANSAVTDAKIAGMAASKLTGALPALDGSALTGVDSITSADVWEMSTNYSPGGGAYVTANWNRSNDAGVGFIGTGMSESSGVFTFPSTGIWEVTGNAEFFHDGNDGSVGLGIYVTTDNSSYNETGINGLAGQRTSSDPQMSSFTRQFIDVTDTSNVKIKYYISSANPCHIEKIQAMFMRLGDT